MKESNEDSRCNTNIKSMLQKIDAWTGMDECREKGAGLPAVRSKHHHIDFKR